MDNRRTGSEYEARAAEYLTAKGYRILEKNFRCRQGEIDLIARDGSYLVFVEVKYRSSLAKGAPAEAVGPLKQRRIRQTAVFYLYSRGLGLDSPCRFDVVSITGNEILLIQNAF